MTITLLAPDGVPVTAKQERQARAASHGGGSGRRLGGRSGFRVDTPSDVFTVTSTTWTLNPCAAMIDPKSVTHQGVYGWSTDAVVTGSINPAHDTYSRIDVVSIEVWDDSAGDASGLTESRVKYLVGTPSATPVAPAYQGLLVATITVPVLGGGAPSAVLNPARYVAAGAPQPVWSVTEFDALVPFESFTVRRMDLSGAPLWVYRSGAWVKDTTVGHVADGSTSTGLAGNGIMCNSVDVTLGAGRRYRAMFRFAGRSSEASLGVLASIRTSAVGDTTTAGTVIPFDQIVYTAPRANTWGALRAEVTWTQSADATVAVKAVLARVAGTAAYDIADRTLYVEDIGAA